MALASATDVRLPCRCGRSTPVPPRTTLDDQRPWSRLALLAVAVIQVVLRAFFVLDAVDDERRHGAVLLPDRASRRAVTPHEIGLIDHLCEQVLERACREISSLKSRRISDRSFSVSINLSCRQFGQTTLVQNIENILTETGFAPHRLKLEITESVFFEHQDRAVAMLDQLRETGIEINIDDFGTGYSNLGYLKKLPVSALKIDRSFVSMIDADGANDEIVRAIITLARNLGLKVIAEGVESQVQLDVLKQLGCESAQGYLFAEPMRFQDLLAFVSDPRPGPGTIPAGRVQDVSNIGLVQ